jgi:hypothetical protein
MGEDWMESCVRTPVTAAVFAGMTVLLSGCIAYDAASTVVHVGATAVSTTADVAGDIATAPFDHGDAKK